MPPRLYVETLNEMIDMQTVRIASLNNRVPNAVLALEVFGAADMPPAAKAAPPP